MCTNVDIFQNVGSIFSIYILIYKRVTIWCFPFSKICHRSYFHNPPRKLKYIFRITFNISLNICYGQNRNNIKTTHHNHYKTIPLNTHPKNAYKHKVCLPFSLVIKSLILIYKIFFRRSGSLNRNLMLHIVSWVNTKLLFVRSLLEDQINVP